MRAIVPAEVAPEVQQTYQVQLAHVSTCPRCRSEAPCEDGRRIRRALQAARAAATPPMNARRDGG